MTTESFAARFRYKRTFPFSRIRDVSQDAEPQGACGTFAWSVLSLETGGKPWRAILTCRALLWRCKSPSNGITPRHAVLWVRGKGYIDSTVREWRDTPAPHKLRWPMGAPVLAVALSIALSLPASAQQACLALPQFLDGLAEKYAETPRMSGLAGNQLLVITASDAGTWTALMVNPDGTACMVSAGEAFVIAPVAAPGVLN